LLPLLPAAAAAAAACFCCVLLLLIMTSARLMMMMMMMMLVVQRCSGERYQRFVMSRVMGRSGLTRLSAGLKPNFSCDRHFP
jgi:hypothetical protein